MKKALGLILAIVIFWPLTSGAAVLPGAYPRLANYFLKWEILDAEVPELAKWNLLILDMEVQENSRPQLLEIRRLNPQVIILAYITSQEILDNIDYYNKAYLRQELARHISDGWWLKDSQGNKISNWPDTFMFNLSNGAIPNSAGQRFNDYLPEFVVNELQSTGLWDGVFYDNTWGDVAWINNKNLDLNNDGVGDDQAEADRAWAEGFNKMLVKTRSLAGKDFIIIGNGRVYDPYQSLLNGMMLESFPSAWENGGTWTGSMKTYLKLPFLNVYPPVSVINIYDKNQANYRHMRYGLTSALLGDGFYSYDYDVTNHGQTWWYDEYNIKLGSAQSLPYNLLANNSEQLKPGLWRRDFKNGITIINSTSQKQTYLFSKEEFEKIKGEQDPVINSGERINYIQLAPQDGLVLLKRSTLIHDSAFTNGYFFRVFSAEGKQTRNGFFSYVSSYPGEAELIITAGGESGENDLNLSAAEGRLNLYKDGKKIAAWQPYGQDYKKSMSLAADIQEGNFTKIVIGAGVGGGPQVQILNSAGKLVGSFFAYDKKLRGGVNVALADIDGDGQPEIITGPGSNDEPRVKIFSLKGILKNSFLAYDFKFRGGVNVAAGDINDDGRAEIITGPVSSGGPQIRIFTGEGKNLNNFFAYDSSYHGGVKVSVSDINEDGSLEILVGLKNFY
jgi:hypothetical protein